MNKKSQRTTVSIRILLGRALRVLLKEIRVHRLPTRLPYLTVSSRIATNQFIQLPSHVLARRFRETEFIDLEGYFLVRILRSLSSLLTNPPSSLHQFRMK